MRETIDGLTSVRDHKSLKLQFINFTPPKQAEDSWQRLSPIDPYLAPFKLCSEDTETISRENGSQASPMDRS